MDHKPIFTTEDTWSTVSCSSRHQEAWANLKKDIADIRAGSCDTESLQKSIRAIMNQSRSPSVVLLRNMYILFSREGNDAIDLMCDALKAYIHSKAGEMSINEEDKSSCLSNLSKFIETICKPNFLKAGSLVDSVDRTFLEIMIMNHPVILLMRDLDIILSTEQEWEELKKKLDKALVLCNTIKEGDRQRQDHFLSLYVYKLAIRHIFGKSPSLQGELYMISQLEKEGQYTKIVSKCKNVLEDVKTSKALNETFHCSHLSTKGQFPNIEMQVIIMKDRRHWPPFPEYDIACNEPLDWSLPVKLNTFKTNFENFYTSENKGKVIRWQDTLWHCVLSDGVNYFGCSVTQAAILMLFDDGVLTCDDILKSTGISRSAMAEAILPLTKCGILQEIESTDLWEPLYKYRVNEAFVYDQYTELHEVKMETNPPLPHHAFEHEGLIDGCESSIDSDISA